jgi:tetratricopeptide (TPR) repeat protein
MKKAGRPALEKAMPVWILALAVICSLWAMRAFPVNRVQYSFSGDTQDHFALILAAAQGLKEGQFPLREIPHVMLRLPPVYQRCAYYQFYAVLPMTLAGGMVLAGLNPWHALGIILFLSFLAGFLGIRALTRRLGGNEEAGAAAGICYTLAPYHLLSFSARGAFVEEFAFGLLPWIFLFSWRAAREKGRGNVAALGLLWATLMHTNHIYHAWLLPMLALGLLLGRWQAKGEFNISRPAAGYGIGLALSAWFVFPGYLAGRHFLGLVPEGSAAIPNPFPDLISLVAYPWLYPLVGLNPEAMDSYPVGWPILAGVVLFAVRKGRAFLKEPFFWLFLAVFLLAWSPQDVVKDLGPLRMIQFKCRFLVFLCLFGSILAGLSLQGLSLSFSRAALLFLFLFQAAVHAPFQAVSSQPFSLDEFSNTVEKQGVRLVHPPYYYVIPETEAQRMGGYPDLELASAVSLKRFELGPGLEILSPTAFPEAQMETGLWTRISFKGVRPASLALLPAAWFPGLYRMEINGRPAAYGRVENRLALGLPEGDVELRFKLAGIRWANWLSLAAWAALLIFAAVRIFRGQPRPKRKRLLAGLVILWATGPAALKATDTEFALSRMGGQLAMSIMEFAESGRCFQEALNQASTDAEKSLALSGLAAAELGQGNLKAAGREVFSALDAARRSKDGAALFEAWMRQGEFYLRAGRPKEAGAANGMALREAAKGLPSPRVPDQVYLQQASILAALGKKKEAGLYLEKTWESWGFRPDYLYAASRETLSRAVLAYLDLRDTKKALVIARIYSDREHLAPDSLADPLLKAEWGAAEICRKFGRTRSARAFLSHALPRLEKARGQKAEAVTRMRNLLEEMKLEAGHGR